jgi:DNA phosphorothioation-dependent restriction protein DptH
VLTAPARPKLTAAIADKVVELHRGGLEPAEIGRELDLSRMEVVSILGVARIESAVEEDAASSSGDDAAPATPFATLPPPIEPTLEPGAKEVDAAAEASPTSIFLGDEVEYSSPVYWEPRNTSAVPNPHLMIMGESGFGKTYATQCLIAELARTGVPSVIFDFGQGFESETLDPMFLKVCNPAEHLIGEQGLALNPLQIFEKDVQGPNAVATRLADIFDAAFRLGDIQRKVLVEAALHAFDDVGITRADPNTWKLAPPTVDQLRQVLDALAGDKQYASAKNALSLSARLMTFFMLTQFRDDATWSWDDILTGSRVHILQFRGLEGKTQRVLVEMLLWHLFFHLKAQGQNALRVYCVLDEAHHLSFRDTGPVNALLREARKFGVGLIFASQQPADFSDVAYSNTASKLIFQTADQALKVSKFLAPKVATYSSPEEIRDAIGDLPRGCALFISRNKGDVVEIAPFARRATLWGPVA